MPRDTRPPKTGPTEKEVLVGFLDYLRTAIIAKASGVPEPAIRTAGVPSGTSLLGLVKHLTHVERHWLLDEPTTNWRATFRPSATESAEEIINAYRETTTRANKVIADTSDLAAPREGSRPSTMRWTLTHLIEETARHAGHADILREQIDGKTGR